MTHVLLLLLHQTKFQLRFVPRDNFDPGNRMTRISNIFDLIWRYFFKKKKPGRTTWVFELWLPFLFGSAKFSPFNNFQINQWLRKSDLQQLPSIAISLQCSQFFLRNFLLLPNCFVQRRRRPKGKWISYSPNSKSSNNFASPLPPQEDEIRRMRMNLCRKSRRGGKPRRPPSKQPPDWILPLPRVTRFELLTTRSGRIRFLTFPLPEVVKNLLLK